MQRLVLGQCTSNLVFAITTVSVQIKVVLDSGIAVTLRLHLQITTWVLGRILGEPVLPT